MEIVFITWALQIENLGKERHRNWQLHKIHPMNDKIHCTFLQKEVFNPL